MRSSQACVTTAWPYGGRAYTPTDPTQVEAARCTLEEVQAALRANTSDSNTVYARDSARAAYMEALAALRAQYEERQSRGARYAAASERVASAVGNAPAVLEGEAVPLVTALNTALPVLKTVRHLPSL